MELLNAQCVQVCVFGFQDGSDSVNSFEEIICVNEYVLCHTVLLRGQIPQNKKELKLKVEPKDSVL